MASWMIGEYGSNALCKSIYPIWSVVNGLAAIA